ncbi:probable membrane-associated kinase regulator 4 [Nicotiana sylvestris]|uniref:Probable membrane-associated kinase regulator 4 n=1 Tax=Nicotiana sylvestris TaxID=4096 RepID=A0A1U7WA82_NICSY|nr:PREDICTED: probable membrane-associated kinase regulator 4 [Nicotiana sylvestris]
MATNPPQFSSSKIKNVDEEDYIDMEVSSCTSSSPQSRDFEFQMSSISIDKEITTTSPADELFYRGKLLPLHLPPRLEMVQKLLHTSNLETFQEEERFSINSKNSINAYNIPSWSDLSSNPTNSRSLVHRTTSSNAPCTNTSTPFESYSISPSESCRVSCESDLSLDLTYSRSLVDRTTSSTAPCTNTSTPFESCNISPSESCRVSCELNPDEYFFEWSTEFGTFINEHPKKTWSKKLKLVKQSLISQKIKASKAYLNLKSLFNKSACSDETDQQVFSTKDCENKYIKVSKKTPFGHIGKCTQPTLANMIRNIEKEGVEDNVNSHRKSFSAVIKRHSPTKCLSSSSSNGSSSSSSSSFSLNSNGFYELNLLKRSCSANTEIEGSIEAAIAHCKKSQELCNPKRRLIEAGINSMSISKIAASEIQERPDLCRI